MTRQQLIYFIVLLFLYAPVYAQHVDSTLGNLQKIPTKYINGIDRKINQYNNRITSKTEKTLTKLSRWENKIQGLLQKVNPEAADRLFGNNQLTFETLLQKIKQGEAVAFQYHAQYDKYRDELTTSIKFLENQKENLDSGVIEKIAATSNRMKELNTLSDSTEAIQQFIKERKGQLINESFRFIGKSKYLSKMNKEVYYYSETLQNYKELFNDRKKTEEVTISLLNNIPTFKQFFQQNSMLSSLFGGGSGLGATPSLEGLQTRSQVLSIIQNQIFSGGPNGQNIVKQNIQAAKEQLNNLKSKIANLGKGGADVDDRLGTFKPNNQKTKTFKQRLEFGSNFQSQGSSSYFPNTTDIALTAAYKLNNNTIIGIGSSFKIGLGKSINDIRITTEGIGLRSFAECKIKGNFYGGAGFEYNYQKPTGDFLTGIQMPDWQKSGLAGISKIISAKGKFYRKTKVQLFWDFLSYSQFPKTSPVKFRTAYVF